MTPPAQVRSVAAPTSGVLLLLMAAGLLHLLSRVTAGAFLVLGSAACLAVALVGLLLRPRLGAVTGRRVLHGRAAAGQTLETTLVVVNGGRWTSPALVVTDELPGHETLRVAVPRLPPGAQAVLRRPRGALRRGVGTGGVLRLAASSPVGLIATRRDLPLGGEVLVHPAAPPARLAAPATASPDTALRDAAASRPVGGRGLELLGLRPWRPGEPYAALSARATARSGRPVVLERERDTGSRLVVLVGGGGSGPDWELAVSTACGAALEAVAQGSPPVLLGRPAPAAPRRADLLDWFAACDDAPRLTAERVRGAAAAAGRGGRIVLVAPTEAGDRLAARRAAQAAGCTLVVAGETGPDRGAARAGQPARA